MPPKTFLDHANMNHRPAGDHLGRSVQEVALWPTEHRLQANPFIGREQRGVKVKQITPRPARRGAIPGADRLEDLPMNAEDPCPGFRLAREALRDESDARVAQRGLDQYQEAVATDLGLSSPEQHWEVPVHAELLKDLRLLGEQPSHELVGAGQDRFQCRPSTAVSRLEHRGAAARTGVRGESIAIDDPALCKSNNEWLRPSPRSATILAI
jgi:hypothetical protein